MRATVYNVRNTVTGEEYVGVTRFDVEKRWKRHLYTARREAKTRLHRAILEYGPKVFHVTAVAMCAPKHGVEVERAVIQQCKPSYNQTNGGQFTVGRRVAREVVDRIRQANIGKKRTPEQRAANSAAKREQYATRPGLRAAAVTALKKARANLDREKQRAAASISSRNRQWSEESRKKLSVSCMWRRYEHLVRPVECITLNTVFDSASEAAKACGLSVSSVRHAVLGYCRFAGGLEFRYTNKSL